MEKYQPRSKLRKDIVKQIVRGMRQGCSRRGAALMSGIDEGTLSSWEEEIAEKEIEPLAKCVKESDVPERDRSPESREVLLAFLQREMTKAHKARLTKLVKGIERAGQEPKHWTALAWLLERTYPEIFGRPERNPAVQADGEEINKYIQSNLEAAARRMNEKDDGL